MNYIVANNNTHKSKIINLLNSLNISSRGFSSRHSTIKELVIIFDDTHVINYYLLDDLWIIESLNEIYTPITIKELKNKNNV